MKTFTTIPAELRNEVYERILSKDGREVIAGAIFRVNRQVHREATSYYYENGNFFVETPTSNTPGATILPPIADKYLRYLRNLSVYATTGQGSMQNVQDAASTIATLPAIRARFNKLTIVIWSRLSNLLNSRVDDSVMDWYHPITVALRGVVASGVARQVVVDLRGAWFAPGVVNQLQSQAITPLDFYRSGAPCFDPNDLQRTLSGRFASTHLTALGVDNAHMEPPSPGPGPSPSPVSSSLSTLDTFSVSSFSLGNDDGLSAGASSSGLSEPDVPFFDEEDIQEWEEGAEEDEDVEMGMEEEEDEEEEDLEEFRDEDLEMEEVPQAEADAIMANMYEVEQMLANERDISYMVNFMPELL
ncbi:hypothetical protein IQ07DRAFT_276627 [Pyrenochaeta sp. DS3sAY3a]|nr:hypothetical protein IQ07DRAFT_276627 [Pyrenochaeta sp. DS3sAY3a]